MSYDTINEIKEVEKQAEDLISAARDEARDTLQKAALDADNAYEEIIAKARHDGEALLDRTESEVAQDVEHKEQENVQLCQKIKDGSEMKLNEVASFIMERIVGSYGLS